MARDQFVIFAIICVIVIAFAAGLTAGPVSRSRLERFASRQGLTVTVANGGQIIRYLATTRRWRVAGLTTGWLLGVTASFLLVQIGNVLLIALFGGWFAGALVAEIRVAHLGHGLRRAASLQPRRPTSYVSRAAWAAVPVAAGLAVLVSAGILVARATGRADPRWWSAVWLVVALGAAAVIRVVQRLVLRRPQPLAAPDVLAADDAIRSRSLHVLAGGGAALILLCVLAQLGTVHPVGGGIEVVRAFGVIMVAIVGNAVATSTWSVRRPGRTSDGSPLEESFPDGSSPADFTPADFTPAGLPPAQSTPAESAPDAPGPR